MIRFGKGSWREGSEFLSLATRFWELLLTEKVNVWGLSGGQERAWMCGMKGHFRAGRELGVVQRGSWTLVKGRKI